VPLQTVESTRLYRQIAEQISTLIDRGEFPSGSRLPAERELAVLLGVSRTSVREAIIALELAGRVEGARRDRHLRRRGAAAPKAQWQRRAARRRRAGPVRSPRGTRDDRRRDRGARGAKRAKADIAALRGAIERMREHADDAERRDAADREFHVLIAEMTRNGALPLAVAHLWELRFGEIFARIEAHFHTPALRAKTLADHEAIVAALETHDPEAARQAMHRHLQRVAREFQRRWEESGGGKSGDSRGSKARAPDKLTGEGAGGRVATRLAGDDGTTTSTDPHRNADRTR
jgi:DNA-binding FadR family transcriptional regulator